MSAYDLLLAGDVLGAAVAVYTDVMGFWFYVIGLTIVEILIYYKSKSLPMMSIIGILASSSMLAYNLFPPEAIGVFYLIIVMSVAGMLYSVFGPKGG